jgi:hypothetical protein
LKRLRHEVEALRAECDILERTTSIVSQSQS